MNHGNEVRVKISPEAHYKFLDVSAFYPRVRTLDISDTQIEQIDISHCSHLTDLTCSRSQLKILDVFNHPRLKTITAKDMPKLHNVYIQECKALTDVIINSNVRLNMDFTGCVKLNHVDASKSKLADICLHECRNLKILDCSYTNLVYLDLNHNPLIQLINISRTPIYLLKIKQCHNLQHLFMRGTNIATLDLMMCKSIRNLDLRDSNMLTMVLMKSSVSKANHLYKNKFMATQ